MTCVAYISQFDLGSTRAVREVVQAIVSLLHTLSSSSSLTSSRAASPPSLTASWQIVLKVLQHLQVLFFRHLHYLADADRAFFVDTVAEFLHDPHVEVRQLAGVTLSGLVQCTGGMREDNPVAAQVRAVAESLLAASGTALPKRRAGQPVPEGFADQIRTRHAGVLALAALVRAHPYDVPATTLPLVLVKLAHYAEDPVPVGPAVKSVFAEFKRTHAETWHRDILAFDDDQRAVLVDMLVSPSYYA
ncbi:hypothetical protein BC828DRAFT_347828 [Blastocladiella britannica]|nr:hypothetical protein BC828DRAFT_347828 [Blastocladiella britannica]